MAQLTLPQLVSHLWKAADILRGAIDAADDKDRIFGLLFFKRLFDVRDEEHEELLAKYGMRIWRQIATHIGFISKGVYFIGAPDTIRTCDLCLRSALGL